MSKKKPESLSSEKKMGNVSPKRQKTKASGPELASSAPVAAGRTTRTGKPLKKAPAKRTRKAAPQPTDGRAGKLTASDSPHEEIARLAYALWQDRGCPHGSPEEDWRHAEEKVRRKAAVAAS